MAQQKNAFPPVSREDMRARGIDQLDFIFVSGDAYIDHPSFGAAIITRLLESRGYTVGIIAQPDWHGVEPFRALGKPKLAFLISSGNIDSMVNHYSFRLAAGNDAYTKARCGKTADRATIVYANRCKQANSNVPIIIAASKRAFAALRTTTTGTTRAA